jgi:hypothetical protein
MMRRVYSPETEAERVFLESLLQAREIPYHIDSGGLGSLFPGLPISRKWVMVPDGYEQEAIAVIRDALPRAEDVEYEDIGWLQRLRVIGEALLFGWFISGRPKREKSRQEVNDGESN